MWVSWLSPFPVWPSRACRVEGGAQALRPLTRSVFWTYWSFTRSARTCGWPGVDFAARPLAAGGLLAQFVTGFITVYWGVRVVVQFTLYDRSVAQGRLLFRLAEIGYVVLFIGLTLTYGFVTCAGGYDRLCEDVGDCRGAVRP